MPKMTDVGEVTRIGTRGYGAPELLLADKEAQTSMDVFSFGVVIMQTLLHPEVAEHNMFTHSVRAEETFPCAIPPLPYGRNYLQPYDKYLPVVIQTTV